MGVEAFEQVWGYNLSQVRLFNRHKKVFNKKEAVLLGTAS